jgi:hypothetical protein
MGMLTLAETYEDMLKRGDIQEDRFMKVSDLARASIVISVSAMDGYFTRKFAETLIPFLRKKGPTKGIVKVLEKAGFDITEGIRLLNMNRPFRRIRTLVEGYLDRVVAQKFAVIDELFLCFGYKDFSHNVQKRTHRKRMLRTIEILIERRHDIVHDGDVDSRGRLKPLDIKQTRKRLKELARFVWYSERIINQQMNKLRLKKQLTTEQPHEPDAD